MPRPKNQLVVDLMAYGFSRRDAFRVANIKKHRIPWHLYCEGLLSTADAARLAKEWPYHGEQAIMACHVMNGWKLKDAEDAYLVAIQIVMKEALSLDWDMPMEELMAYSEEHLMVPMRANLGVVPAQFRAPAQRGGNSAKWHDSGTTEPTPDLAEAVAEIQRLRAMLHDLGADPNP